MSFNISIIDVPNKMEYKQEENDQILTGTDSRRIFHDHIPQLVARRLLTIETEALRMNI